MVARSVSLVAAAVLLFGLPQCAIDDRELEEQEDDDNGGSSNGGSSNGGSSSGGSSNGGSSAGTPTPNGGTSNGGTGPVNPICQPMSDDTECTVCTKENCCNEFSTCVASEQCAAYVACGVDCVDTSCIEACDSLYPEGSSEFNAIVVCGNAHCPACQ